MPCVEKNEHLINKSIIHPYLYRIMDDKKKDFMGWLSNLLGGKKVEEAPVEEAPVEEAPVEEAPVEEAPVEEAPAEDEKPEPSA